MPLQNRVTPTGEIVATEHRGGMMGNRGGALHGESQVLGRKRWVTRQWICCVLSFKDRWRPVMQPNRYTELFFLDEATALAAGHRPCFECRRADALRFADGWGKAHGWAKSRPSAPEMDARLHAERVGEDGGKRTWPMPLAELPETAFVLWQGAPAIVCRQGGIGSARLRPWSFEGYGIPFDVAPGPIELLTPPATVAVIRAGYRPLLHATWGT